MIRANFKTMKPKSIIKWSLLASTAIVIAGCGNSKSNELRESSQPVTISGNSGAEKPLTSCNKSANSDISLNVNAYFGPTGQVDSNWLKVKFNFLNQTLTTGDNTVRFFKWRMNNGEAQLDQTPLVFYTYPLSSPTQTSIAMNGLSTKSITSTQGFFVALQDDSASYQVLKVAVYNKDGQVIAQINTLIPQFNAVFEDYKLTDSGAARPATLLELHPLKASAGLSPSESSSYFQAFCF
jgi:hypothetical protein